MNKIKLAAISILLVVCGILVFNPARNALISYFHGHEHSAESDILFYQCPMHHQITSPEPGECPICHMRLRPVYREGTQKAQSSRENGNGTAAPAAANGAGIRISAERQALIGVRKARVTRKSLSREVRAAGVVAFDPELQVAIREYFAIGPSDATLRQAAISRLKILGMGDDEIRNLGRNPGAYSGLASPGGGSVWVYASIYESDASLVKPGMTASVRLTSRAGKTFQGIVRSISPIVNSTARTLNARVEVLSRDPDLRPSSYVSVVIQSGGLSTLTIPRSALIDTGEKQYVYVVNNDNEFSPRNIVTGTESGEDIAVVSGLSEGEMVVTDATFMIDSESQMRISRSGQTNQN